MQVRFSRLVSAAVLIAASVPAAAGPLRVMLLETMYAPAIQEMAQAFIEEFDRTAREQGVDYRFTRLNAGGNDGAGRRLIAQARVDAEPDIVVTIATLATQVAREVFAASGTPVVFFGVGDPVGTGIVDQLDHPPGGRVTGRSDTIPSAAKLDLVLRALGPNPHARPWRFGYVYSSYPSSIHDIAELERAAQARDDVEFIAHRIDFLPGSDGTERMVAKMRLVLPALAGRVDGYWEPGGPLGILPRATRTLTEHGVAPVLVATREESVRGGALLSIWIAPRTSAREAANITHAILAGASPGDIPVRAAGEVGFALNLTTVERLAVPMPLDMLEMAGKSIYR